MAEHAQFGDERPYQCITEHPSFYHLCLYGRQLNNIAHMYRMEGVNDRLTDRNQRLRYTACRAYTAWVHGYLGRRQRREIPHCVMKRFRMRFPDQQAEYHGFQPPEQVV